jgi:MoaA/NifB/PqqE/SkfB family radical SAM enzyme
MTDEVPAAVDYEMRGGNHPDQEMNAWEYQTSKIAYQRCLTNPEWAKRGFKKAYNLTHLGMFWMSRNPQIVNMMYRLQPYPVYVEMEIVQTACPLNCIQCEKRYWDEPVQKVSFDDFKKVMDMFPNLKWAGINALGDPFTNKEYLKMIGHLSNKGVCQEVYTTATLCEEKDMEKFVEMGFEYMKFSVDAATKETYEKIRPGADWDKTMRNIKALDYYKKKHHSTFPIIEFHYLVHKPTINEAMDFLDVVKKLDIDVGNVMYSRLLHYFPEIKDLFIDFPEELAKQLAEKGRKLNIPVAFNADCQAMKPPANECLAWWMPYIFPDGTVISCCCMNEQNRRQWQRDTSMGNVFQKHFREIWNDKPYTQLRNSLKVGKIRQANPVCNICNIYDIEKGEKK